MWHLTSAYMKCVHGRAGGRTLFITKFLGWIVYQILLPMVLRARESSAITLFKDFETLFAFLLNSLNDHYFGQYLVRLVVFLGDDERIFLLLFETIISQACKYVLRPPKRLTFQIVLFLATQPQFSQVCLSSLVTSVPHQPRLRAKTRTRSKLLGITKLAYRIYSSKRRGAYLFFRVSGAALI